MRRPYLPRRPFGYSRPGLEVLEDRVVPNTYMVTNTNDSGAGSLRQAIVNANNHAGADLIKFNIAGSGVHTIQPTSFLPQITDPVTIDGTSQPGYTTTPLIEVNGARAGSSVDGLDVSAGATTIKGLAVNGFNGNGISLFSNGGDLVTADFLGTDPTGTTAKPNTSSGVLVLSANNTVGGVTAPARNLLSGDSFGGAQVFGSSATGNVIEGNYVGTDVTGTKALPNTSVGVIVNSGAGNNTVGGTASGAGNLVSGNGGIGVQVADSGTTGNLVAGNTVGTDLTGTVVLPNQSDGILVNNSATNNTVGGTSTGSGNLASGNVGIGIQVADSGTTGNLVEGNTVGTNPGGTAALPNQSDGILVNFSATNNTIGGTSSAARNLASGNAQVGIQVQGANGNLVEGNYVGTDVTGSRALPNQSDGILVNGAAQNNTIGGATPGAGNLVSGNTQIGIQVGDAGTTGNVLQGNFVGTSAAGNQILANQNDGILINFSSGSTTVGGAGGARNLVSGNVGYGIQIDGTSNNAVQGNLVGTDVTGTLAFPNTLDGIIIENGGSNNTVGGVAAGLGNTVAFNTGDGVHVTDVGSTGNSIRGNVLFGNGGQDLDLGDPGVECNHIGSTTGPNDLQNYPVITAASPGATTSVSGTLNSLPGTVYTLDFYADPTPNLSFYGPGKVYLGSTTVTTDANGNASFSVTLSSPTSASQWVTATATDPSGNTSEFCGDRQLPFSQGSLSPTAWTALGPAPVAGSPDYGNPVMSGRVVFGMADPTNANVMYLEADGGGVWKTSDWQDPSPVWTPLTDTQPSTYTGYYTYHGLAFFQGSPNLVFAVAQGPGGGVLKSTNGGSTWTLLGSSVFNQAEITSVAVDPINANNLYVSVLYGSVTGGVYKSTNGGTSWTNETVSFHNGAATDVLLDPAHPNILYAGLTQDTSTPGSNGIWESTNNGVSWTQLTSGVLSGSAVGEAIRLALAPSNDQVLYATVFDPALGNPPYGLPHRYVSTNAGASWTSLAALPGNDEYRTGHVLLAVDPHNPATVYVNGDHTVYQSTNSGASWSLLNNYEDPNAGFFDNSGNFILVGDHGIYLTGATPSTFLDKQGNLQTNEFYTLTLDPTNANVVYGVAQDQFQPVKYNGYPAWTALAPVSQIADDGTGETGKILVSPANPARLYDYVPANQSTFVYRSDDGGATWTAAGTGIDTSLFGFNLAYAAQKSFVLDPNNPDRLLLGTNKVYETTNDGTSWTAISPVLSPSSNVTDQYIVRLAVSSSASGTVYAATADGRLFVTTNDGGAWTEIDSGLPRDSFDQIGAIQIDPTNALHAFIAATRGANSVFGPLHVWETANGGTSWTSIVGNLPSTDFTTDLVVDWRFSPAILYAGTARGVYRSLNDGAAWSLFGTGLPDTQVYDLELQTSQDLLAVGLYGRGAFEILVPGPATHFVLSAPSSVTAGTSFTVTVTALDALNVAAVTYTGTVHFTSTDPLAKLPANYKFKTGDNGSHVFTVTLNTTGQQTLTVKDTKKASIKGSVKITVNHAGPGPLLAGVLPQLRDDVPDQRTDPPSPASLAGSAIIVAEVGYGRTTLTDPGMAPATGDRGNQAVNAPNREQAAWAALLAGVEELLPVGTRLGWLRPDWWTMDLLSAAAVAPGVSDRRGLEILD